MNMNAPRCNCGTPVWEPTSQAVVPIQARNMKSCAMETSFRCRRCGVMFWRLSPMSRPEDYTWQMRVTGTYPGRGMK